MPDYRGDDKRYPDDSSESSKINSGAEIGSSSTRNPGGMGNSGPEPTKPSSRGKDNSRKQEGLVDYEPIEPNIGKDPGWIANRINKIANTPIRGKRKLMYGGLFALLVPGIFSLAFTLMLPFKLLNIKENIQEYLGSKLEVMVEKRVTRFLATRAIKGFVGQGTRVTGNPMRDIIYNYRTNKFEATLKQKGIEVELNRDGTLKSIVDSSVDPANPRRYDYTPERSGRKAERDFISDIFRNDSIPVSANLKNEERLLKKVHHRLRWQKFFFPNTRSKVRDFGNRKKIAMINRAKDFVRGKPIEKFWPGINDPDSPDTPEGNRPKLLDRIAARSPALQRLVKIVRVGTIPTMVVGTVCTINKISRSILDEVNSMQFEAVASYAALQITAADQQKSGDLIAKDVGEYNTTFIGKGYDTSVGSKVIYSRGEYAIGEDEELSPSADLSNETEAKQLLSSFVDAVDKLKDGGIFGWVPIIGGALNATIGKIVGPVVSVILDQGCSVYDSTIVAAENAAVEAVDDLPVAKQVLGFINNVSDKAMQAATDAVAGDGFDPEKASLEETARFMGDAALVGGDIITQQQIIASGGYQLEGEELNKYTGEVAQMILDKEKEAGLANRLFALGRPHSLTSSLVRWMPTGWGEVPTKLIGALKSVLNPGSYVNVFYQFQAMIAPNLNTAYAYSYPYSDMVPQYGVRVDVLDYISPEDVEQAFGLTSGADNAQILEGLMDKYHSCFNEDLAGVLLTKPESCENAMKDSPTVLDKNYIDDDGQDIQVQATEFELLSLYCTDLALTISLLGVNADSEVHGTEDPCIREDVEEERAVNTISPNPESAQGVDGGKVVDKTTIDPKDIVSVRNVGKVNARIQSNVEDLLAAAKRDDLTLTGGGFRTAEAQISLRISHCGPTQYDIFEKPSDQCSPPTARPGRSNHEKGLAIDFSNCSTRSTKCYQWLSKNAARFGLYNLPSEPWHWSVDGR